MGLAELFTKIFVEPCRSAPKSPPPPDSPDAGKLTEADTKASPTAAEKTIVEVLPCGDVTNNTVTDQPSPTTKPETHADGFGVNQIKAAEPLDGASEVLTTKQQVTLNEETKDAIQKIILEVFGFEIHRGLNAKAWDDRAQALAAAKQLCVKKQIPATVSNAVFMDACCKLLLVAIQDKVMPVYFDGLELLKYLCGEFFVEYPESHEVVRNNLEEFLPVIIAKTADRNARSLEGTRQTLVFLGRCSCVGTSPVMAHIFSPVQNHKELAAIRGRLDLINHVIDEFGFGKSSTITMQLVMGFVRPHLDATDEKVRRAAVEVTVNCYKHKGDRTLKYVTNVKPALLKLLQSRFAELDKPTKGRKQAHSAQGLPAVRNKGRKSGLPKRDTQSQPSPKKKDSVGINMQHSTNNLQHSTHNMSSPISTNNMSMGANSTHNQQGMLSSPNNMIPSPLSVQAAPSRSLREEPPYMSSPQVARSPLPGSVGGGGGFNEMQGVGMGDELDLDDDLMNEIEAY